MQHVKPRASLSAVFDVYVNDVGPDDGLTWSACTIGIPWITFDCLMTCFLTFYNVNVVTVLCFWMWKVWLQVKHQYATRHMTLLWCDPLSLSNRLYIVLAGNWTQQVYVLQVVKNVQTVHLAVLPTRLILVHRLPVALVPEFDVGMSFQTSCFSCIEKSTEEVNRLWSVFIQN